MQEKKQPQTQQEQAAQSIGWYYECLQIEKCAFQHNQTPDDHTMQTQSIQPESAQPEITRSDNVQNHREHTGSSQEENLTGISPRRLPDSGGSPDLPHEHHDFAPVRGKTGQGASWKVEYARFAETLEGRQYDAKTARAYTKWIRKFQAFTRSKPPEMLSSEDVRAFLVLLGHGDIKTTMIYTHTVKSTTKKEAKSPLDFDSLIE